MDFIESTVTNSKPQTDEITTKQMLSNCSEPTSNLLNADPSEKDEQCDDEGMVAVGYIEPREVVETEMATQVRHNSSPDIQIDLTPNEAPTTMTDVQPTPAATTYETMTAVQPTPAATTYETMTAVQTTPAATTYETMTAVQPTPAATTYETMTAVQTTPAATTYETIISQEEIVISDCEANLYETHRADSLTTEATTESESEASVAATPPAPTHQAPLTVQALLQQQQQQTQQQTLPQLQQVPLQAIFTAPPPPSSFATTTTLPAADLTSILSTAQMAENIYILAVNGAGDLTALRQRMEIIGQLAKQIMQNEKADKMNNRHAVAPITTTAVPPQPILLNSGTSPAHTALPNIATMLPGAVVSQSQLVTKPNPIPMTTQFISIPTTTTSNPPVQPALPMPQPQWVFVRNFPQGQLIPIPNIISTPQGFIGQQFAATATSTKTVASNQVLNTSAGLRFPQFKPLNFQQPMFATVKPSQDNEPKQTTTAAASTSSQLSVAAPFQLAANRLKDQRSAAPPSTQPNMAQLAADPNSDLHKLIKKKIQEQIMLIERTKVNTDSTASEASQKQASVEEIDRETELMVAQQLLALQQVQAPEQQPQCEQQPPPTLQQPASLPSTQAVNVPPVLSPQQAPIPSSRMSQSGSGPSSSDYPTLVAHLTAKSTVTTALPENYLLSETMQNVKPRSPRFPLKARCKLVKRHPVRSIADRGGGDDSSAVSSNNGTPGPEIDLQSMSNLVPPMAMSPDMPPQQHPNGVDQSVALTSLIQNNYGGLLATLAQGNNQNIVATVAQEGATQDPGTAGQQVPFIIPFEVMSQLSTDSNASGISGSALPVGIKQEVHIPLMLPQVSPAAAQSSAHPTFSEATKPRPTKRTYRKNPRGLQSQYSDVHHPEDLEDDAEPGGKYKRFRCMVCPRRFLTRPQLSAHTDLHDGIKPFRCAECKKCFARKDHMKRHMFQHQKSDQKHVCDVCDKEFARRDLLDTHLRMHPESKNRNQCPHCSESYILKVDLVTHMWDHGGDAAKLNNCSLCESRFDSLEELMNHMKFNHAENHPQMYVCPREKCQKPFSSPKLLDAHKASCLQCIVDNGVPI